MAIIQYLLLVSKDIIIKKKRKYNRKYYFTNLKIFYRELLIYFINPGYSLMSYFIRIDRLSAGLLGYFQIHHETEKNSMEKYSI